MLHLQRRRKRAFFARSVVRPFVCRRRRRRRLIKRRPRALHCKRGDFRPSAQFSLLATKKLPTAPLSPLQSERVVKKGGQGGRRRKGGGGAGKKSAKEKGKKVLHDDDEVAVAPDSATAVASGCLSAPPVSERVRPTQYRVRRTQLASAHTGGGGERSECFCSADDD